MADIRQIKVAGHSVGIRGLDEVCAELAGRYAPAQEGALAQEMLSRVKKSNYVPTSQDADYAQALLAELKRRLGLEAGEAQPEDLTVQVLGPGCAGCHQLVQNIMDAMARLGLRGSVELVTDAMEIAAQRVQGQPALIINGQVKSVGSSPSPAQIESWLKEIS
ncbi:MAG: thioredoxin family protein [Thermodesulfobacteriota bacterium]